MKSAHFLVIFTRASWHDTRRVTVCLLPHSLVIGEDCLYTSSTSGTSGYLGTLVQPYALQLYLGSRSTHVCTHSCSRSTAVEVLNLVSGYVLWCVYTHTPMHTPLWRGTASIDNNGGSQRWGFMLKSVKSSIQTHHVDHEYRKSSASGGAR
jgi:hypothetical protein